MHNLIRKDIPLFMKRYVSLEDISDGHLYTSEDLVETAKAVQTAAKAWLIRLF